MKRIISALVALVGFILTISESDTVMYNVIGVVLLGLGLHFAGLINLNFLDNDEER